MSMRIGAVNGKCPCQRCQRGSQWTIRDRALADFGVAGPEAGIRLSMLPLGVQVRRLLARARKV